MDGGQEVLMRMKSSWTRLDYMDHLFEVVRHQSDTAVWSELVKNCVYFGTSFYTVAHK